MNERILLLPDNYFGSKSLDLDRAMEKAARNLNSCNFKNFCEGLILNLFNQTIKDSGADEGTVWLADLESNFLIPALNTGTRCGEWVGKFRQPLSEGLVSMVFASEQPFCHNETWKDKGHSKLLDNQLGVVTRAMMAVPFGFAGQTRGVLSAVQLGSFKEELLTPGTFSQENLNQFILFSEVISSLCDFELIKIIFGKK